MTVPAVKRGFSAHNVLWNGPTAIAGAQVGTVSENTSGHEISMCTKNSPQVMQNMFVLPFKSEMGA